MLTWKYSKEKHMKTCGSCIIADESTIFLNQKEVGCILLINASSKKKMFIYKYNM